MSVTLEYIYSTMDILFGIFISILTFSFFSMSFASIKILSTCMSPFFLTGFRFFIAGVMLLAFSYAFKLKKEINYKVAVAILGVGIFGHCLSNVLESYAIRNIALADGALIYSLTPVVTGVFSKFINKETLNTLQKISVVMVVAGLIIVNYNSIYLGSIYSYLIMSIAMVSAAFIWVQMRYVQILSKGKSSLIFNNALVLLSCGIVGVLISLITGSFNDGISSLMKFPNYNYMIFVILSSNVVAIYLYGILISNFSAVFVSVSGSVSFPLTASLGWMLFNETLRIPSIAGFLVITLGVVSYAIGESMIKK
ncbi:MAG: DMT family transporter [Chlamydiia bacterium]|nr:DMT family transporter [Chlamydiia bacterium]